ncbi:MAG: aminotransferase class III-fold pyridoxal phosphate-dependent enzyme [Candidatus Thiodiazotropha sp.]
MNKSIQISKEYLFDSYQVHNKPKLQKFLRSLNLDVYYNKAYGSYLYYQDKNNNTQKVLDMVGGYGAALFGHNHPAIIEKAQKLLSDNIAIQGQASFRHETVCLSELLNLRLQQETNRSYVITLTNSGAEAVEAAIKHAILAYQRKQKERLQDLRYSFDRAFVSQKNGQIIHANRLPEAVSDCSDLFILLENLYQWNLSKLNTETLFMSVQGNFHGKTMGALSLTHSDQYREPFACHTMKTVFVPRGNVEKLKQVIKKHTFQYYLPKIQKSELSFISVKVVPIVAFFLEATQGEGGVRQLDKKYIQSCQAIAKQHSIPLVIDEIQTGMGRTGSFLCSTQSSVIANYYTLGKSLGGGIAKIGALAIDRSEYIDDFDMIHTSTFADDPFSSSIASTCLQLLDDSTISLCRDLGKQLLGELNCLKLKYPDVIKDVRGTGLMLGLEFIPRTDSYSRILRHLSKQNILGYVLSAYLLHEHNIRVMPALSDTYTFRLQPSFQFNNNDLISLIAGISKLCEILQQDDVYSLFRCLCNKNIIADDVYHECTDYLSHTSQQSTNKRPEKDIHHDYSVAFIAHFIHAQNVKLWDPYLSKFKNTELKEIIDKIYPTLEPFVDQTKYVASTNGQIVRLVVIAMPLDSQQMLKHLKQHDLGMVRDKLHNAVMLARSEGASVVGFGGYNSIVSNNCKCITVDQINLTSGNAFTVAMGMEALEGCVTENGMIFENSVSAVLGAAGNIGSVYAALLADRARKVIYLIKPHHYKKTIRAIYDWCCLNWHRDIDDTPHIIQDLKKHNMIELNSLKTFEDTYSNLCTQIVHDVPIEISYDISDVRNADIVVSSSNSDKPLLYPHHFDDHQYVVCDISVPKNVHPSVLDLPNVKVINGGIVKLPCNPEFKIQGIPLDEGYTFACIAETILLGLSAKQGHFSYGDIDKRQVEIISAIARNHGFKYGLIKSQDSY